MLTGFNQPFFESKLTRFKQELSKNQSPCLAKIYQAWRNSIGFGKNLPGFAKISPGLCFTGAVTEGSVY